MCITCVVFRSPLALIASLVHPIICGCVTSSGGTSVTFCTGRRDARKVIQKVFEQKSILFERESSLILQLNIMVRLRALARKSRRDAIAEESAILTARTREDIQDSTLALSLQSQSLLSTSTEAVFTGVVHLSPPSEVNLVAVMGADPPLGSQEPLAAQGLEEINYTWQETSPVNGKASGMFILHLGSTPQSSPMSRDPPNLVVDRKQLREALQMKRIRGRKGQSGVKRRLEDAMEVLPPCMIRKRRSRGGSSANHGESSDRRGRKGMRYTRLTSEPPPDWVAPPIVVHSRSPVLLRKQLDMLDGMVHVPSLEDSTSNGPTLNVPVSEEDSENDPEWQGEYADFVSDDASQQSMSDDGACSYNEEPLKELGFYNADDDVSTWPFERIWSDDQWQDQSTVLLQDTNNFSGPIRGPTSPVAHHPGEYILRFWPSELLNRVVAETNRYAAQPSQLNPAVTNGRDDWTALDYEELLAWFGILILMGLKEVPHMRCYWDRRPFFNCPLISETMSRNRFEAIVRCSHLVDNESVVTDKSDPTYDKLGKVRWLCESFAHISQELYHNERVLTVDEIMVPYKGRFCNIRQYMKAKPVKFGVKIWALANSESRYVSNIIVYLGADDVRIEGASVGEDAVLNSVAGLEGRGHVIITDNFFTSPRLFMQLFHRGFWATGTVRKTRKGFPPSLAGFVNGQLPERGHLVIKMHRSRQIVAICWMDSKPVFLLSTACNHIGDDSFAGRWIGQERVQFRTSPILLQYQSGMRGVDLVDQQRQQYTTQLHSHKWWHRIFMFVLDSQLLNSYILYACDRKALGVPLLSRSLWHYTLAEFLIRPHMQPGHIRGPLRNLAGGGLHYSASEGRTRRRCVVCGRRTRRMCPGCGGLFQCEGVCYRAVHTQGVYAANGRGLA